MLCNVYGFLVVVSQIFIENGYEQDGIVLGVFWPLLSLEYIKWTLLALAATSPAEDMIKWVWLDMLYLMHVLFVVLVVIGAPPFNSLPY